MNGQGFEANAPTVGDSQLSQSVNDSGAASLNSEFHNMDSKSINDSINSMKPSDESANKFLPDNPLIDGGGESESNNSKDTTTAGLERIMEPNEGGNTTSDTRPESEQVTDPSEGENTSSETPQKAPTDSDPGQLLDGSIGQPDRKDQPKNPSEGNSGLNVPKDANPVSGGGGGEGSDGKKIQEPSQGPELKDDISGEGRSGGGVELAVKELDGEPTLDPDNTWTDPTKDS